MSRTGRPRLPTEIKLLKGTLRRDRTPKNEAHPAAEPGMEPPEYLGELAQVEWRRLMPELERIGLFTMADRSAFAVYCQSYGRWIELEEVITKQGKTFTLETGYVGQRPEVTMSQKERTIMKAFLTEFGLTPASRSRIDVKMPELAKDRDEEELFGGKRTG